MSTLFNYWHYLILGVILLVFIAGVVVTVRQSKPKLVVPMIFSITIVTILMAGLSILVVDKYTKVVKLYNLDNKRILSIEKIVYSGTVKNEGNHKIGRVVFEIKLVNKGHATGKVKAGTFYSPSGFFDFFSGGAGKLYKPQHITEKFVVARNLGPGEAKTFTVYLDYPPYFRSVSEFAKVHGY